MMVNMKEISAQIWEIYPIMEPFMFETEKQFNKDPIQGWMQNNNWFPVVVVAIYLSFIYVAPSLMSSSKEFNLDILLAFWNLGLSAFSAWGSFHTMPHLFYFVTHKSFEETVCDQPAMIWGYGATGLAVQLFILSKIPEVLDTVFLILRKKHLTFLHWYHHVSVLLFCWNSYVTESGAGLYFVAMNYTVHAIMYFYYFSRAIRIVPKNFPSWIITILQITQFVVGTAVVCSGIYFYVYGGLVYGPGTCNNKFSNMVVGAAIYASYLYLFIDFALRRFIFKRTPLKKNVRNGSASKYE
jgi:elongation of very long chain fatty acids protein 6